MQKITPIFLTAFLLFALIFGSPHAYSSVYTDRILLNPGHGLYEHVDGSGDWRFQRPAQVRTGAGILSVNPDNPYGAMSQYWNEPYTLEGQNSNTPYVLEDVINSYLIEELRDKMEVSGFSDIALTREVSKNVGNYPHTIYGYDFPWWLMSATEFFENQRVVNPYGLSDWEWNDLWSFGGTNYYEDQNARGKYGTSIGADTMLSIHTNAYNGDACGVQVFYDDSNGYTGVSSDLSGIIQYRLNESLGDMFLENGCSTVRSMVSSSGYGENYFFEGPAALVEMAFHDNPGDNALLLDTNFRDIATTAIQEGLMEYIGVIDAPTKIALRNDPAGLFPHQALTDVDLEWEPVSNADHYMVYVSFDFPDDSLLIDQDRIYTGVRGTHYPLRSGLLFPETEIRWNVQSVSANGVYSDWVNEAWEFSVGPFSFYKVPNVEFGDAEVSGLTVDPDSNEIQFIVRGEEAGAGDTVIDIGIEMDEMKKTFLQALAIPNHKQWISLDLLQDEFGQYYGSSRTESPFENTDIARNFFEADVEMKFDLFPSSISGDGQLDAGTSADWIDLITASPYWEELEEENFYAFPYWMLRAEIKPNNFQVNDTDGRIVINNADMFLDDEIMNLGLDLSDYELSEAAYNDVMQRLGAYRSQLQNRLSSGALEITDFINGDSPGYRQLREIYPIIALAQWYKTLDIENKPYESLIDSEDLTGIEADPVFDEDHWDSEAFQPLGEENYTDFYGDSAYVSTYGGVGLYDLEVESLGPLSVIQETLLDDVLENGYVQDEDTYYFYGGSLTVSAPDLWPSIVLVDEEVPTENERITLSASVVNMGDEDSGSFSVSFYDEFEGSDGTLQRHFVGDTTVNSLEVTDSVEVEIEWTPWHIGEHEFSAVVDINDSVDESNEANNEVSHVFEVEASIPSVDIIFPANQTTVSNMNLILEGYAFDSKELYLVEEDEVEWFSDVDGLIGVGIRPIVEELSAGEHLITMRATNSRGFSSETQMTIHSLAPGIPLVSILSPVDGQIFSSDLVYSFEGIAEDFDDGDLCIFTDLELLPNWYSSIDGELGLGCILDVALSVGEHEISFTAKTSGIETTSLTNVLVEEGRPNVNIVAPFAGQEFFEDESVTFEGTAIDPQDGDISSSLTWHSDIDAYLGEGSSLELNLSPGEHEITLVAVDSHGLISEEQILLGIVHVAPEVSIISPTAGEEFDEGTSVLLSGTASDFPDGSLTGGSLVWRSSLQGWLGTGENLELDNLLGGTHVISLSATDSDGLETEAEVEMIIYVGQPVTTISQPTLGDSFFYGFEVNLQGSATDLEDGDLTGDSLVWLSILDGELGRGEVLDTSSLSSGDHDIRLRATDSDGWSTSEEIAINIEVPHDPGISLVQPRQNRVFTHGQEVQLRARANDYEDGNLDVDIAWTSDLDGDLGLGANPDPVVLSLGGHVITASVTDSLGAVSEASSSITINQALPIVEIISPADSDIFLEGDPIIFEGSASDYEDGELSGSSLLWSSNLDGELGTGASLEVSDLSIGTHIITFTATDSLGGFASAGLTIIIHEPGVVLLNKFSGDELSAEAEFPASGGEEIVYVDIPREAEVVNAEVEVRGVLSEFSWQREEEVMVDGETTLFYYLVHSGRAPSFIDIDNDNDLDLFTGGSDGRLHYYRNDGSSTTPNWVFVTDHYEGIDTGYGSKPTFVDIDGDNDYDLFSGDSNGTINYYRNDGTITTPNFVTISSRYEDIDVPGYSSPSFVDIDGDNDFDLFIGDDDGFISYYRNDGTITTPNWTFVTDYYEGVDIGYFSSPTFVDIDGDNDFDLFVGGRNSGRLSYYRNDGTITTPNWTFVTDYYEGVDGRTSSKPTFVDIDGDNDYDLFVGGAPSGQLTYYRNDGNENIADWTLITDRYGFIDFGKYIALAFEDIDGDNDYDLFAGKEDGFISYYRNDGSSTTPNWVFVTDEYEGIDVGIRSDPTFVDIDGDNDYDLFIGERYGGISYYRNDGSSTTPNWVFVTDRYENIYGSSPTFVDIDGDNDYDLFIGTYYGYISYYRNDGSSTTPNWTFVTDEYEGIDGGTSSKPTFVDIDGDNDYDLFIGGGFWGLKHFRNDGNENIADLVFAVDDFEDIDIATGLDPAFVDIDGDNDFDLFIAEMYGSLIHYSNDNMISTNPILDATNNGTIDWSFTGEYSGSEVTPDFSDQVNDYLDADTGTEPIVSVPLSLSSETAGILKLSNLNIQYESLDFEAPVIEYVLEVLGSPTAVGLDDVTAGVTDNVELESVEVLFDGVLYEMTLSTEDVYSVDDIVLGEPGIYELQVIATDTSGLQAVDISEVVITGDGYDLYTDENLELPEEPINEGDSVRIGAEIFNFGDSDATDVEVALVVDEVIVDLYTVSTVSVGFSIRIPALQWIATAGEHDISIVVDPNWLIDEFNEDNNEASQTITVGDLTSPIIEEISINPDPVGEGESVTFSVLASDNVEVDRVEVDIFGQTHDLEFVTPSGLYEGSFDASEVGLSTANFTVYDSGGLITLGNESFTVVPLLSDLTLNEFDVSVVENELHVQVHNFGNSDANDFELEFYLDGELRSNNLVSVAALVETELVLPWNVGSGEHELRFILDSANVIPESDELNNELTMSLSAQSSQAPSIVEVLAEPNPAIVDNDVLLQVRMDEQELESINVDWLNVNYPLIYNGATDYFEVSLLASDLGSHSAFIRATALNGVSTYEEVEITVEADLPDFVLGRVRSDYPTLASEAQLISGVLTNEGMQDANQVEVELSVDGVNIETQLVDLVSDEETLVDFTWLAEFGSHEIEITADPQNLVLEADESNNNGQVELTGIDVELPRFESISISDSIYEGGEFDITIHATDNLAVDIVEAELDGVSYEFTFNSADDLYELSLTAPATGIWIIDFLVSDINGLSQETSREIEVYSTEVDLSLDEMDLNYDTFIDGEESEISILLENRGGSDALGTEAQLLIDGVEVDSIFVDVLRGESEELVFTWLANYGEHELEIFIDPSNAVSDTIFAFDLTPPPMSTPIVTPISWTDDTNFLIKWNAVTDPQGIREYSYRIDQGEWISSGLFASASVIETRNGVHSVSVISTDNAGNSSEPGISYLYLDTEAPESPFITEHHMNEGWSAHDSPYLTWLNPGDQGSGVTSYEVIIDEAMPEEILQDIGAETSYHPTLTNGVHSMKVRSVDVLGHRSDWSNEILVSIDLETPETPEISSLTHPLEGEWSLSNIASFDWNEPVDLSSISGYYYSLDHESEIQLNQSDLWQTETSLTLNSLPYMSADPLPISDGEWFFHVAAKDELGHISETADYQILIDSAAPFTELGTVDEQPNSYTVNLSAFDAHSGVLETWYRLDSEPTMHLGTTIEITAPGSHILEFYSRDYAGNTEDLKTLILDIGSSSGVMKISDTEGDLRVGLDDGDQFGTALLNIGDIDGNGVDDMIVGASGDDDGGSDRGAVWILFLNSDGEVIKYRKLSDTFGRFTGGLADGDQFGEALASLADADGNGLDDLIVGAPGDDDAGTDRGAVWLILLNYSGEVDLQTKISANAGGFTGGLADGDQFGTAIANIGDVDSNGIEDLAVSAPGDDDGGSDRGAVWLILLKRDGSVKMNRKISDTQGGFTGGLADGDQFGTAIANIGDVDNNGVNDLIVGASGDDDGGSDRGAIWLILLETDGSVKMNRKISDTQGGFTGGLADGDQFGTAIANIGDVDSNGIEDLAVSAPGDDLEGLDSGNLWLLLFEPDGAIKRLSRIADLISGFSGILDENDYFGSAVINAGDLDGNGIEDLAVSAAGDDDGGSDRGAVWIFPFE